jgi:hypothetical protein
MKFRFTKTVRPLPEALKVSPKPRYRVLMMPITRPYNWRGTGDILRYQQFCNNNPINPLQTRTELQINLIVKL